MEVGVHLRCLLLAFAFTLPCVLSQVWDEPPFLNIAPRPEVEYGEYTSRGQTITMEENIEGEVILAQFNFKDPTGATEPVISSFLTGTNNNLGAVIRKGESDDGKIWYLYITKTQDYEIPAQIRYVLDISVGTKSHTVYLFIKNIDDNAPVIQGGTCQVEELYVGETDCAYYVTDADGALSIDVMTFRIDYRQGEKEVFGKFRELKNDTTSMSMWIFLTTDVELDYLDSQIHIFTIVAIDSLPNEGSLNAVVQVKDMPNQPPIWKTIFASQTFDEKTVQNFKVQAVDGDTGINDKIFYELYDTEDKYPFFSIGNADGTLHVIPIDRDFYQKEVFQFKINAYKIDINEKKWETASTVSIIINDVNDQWPIINDEDNPLFEMDIEEEKFTSLDFDPSIFIHDRDLGENAQYKVTLESVNPLDAADSFIIIPEEGYQKQEFKIIIVEAQNLDFENVTWQNIELTIKSTEIKDPTHVRTASVKLNLINWNDEEPIFTQDEYTAEFEEIVGKGHKVATVLAEDRDIGDTVKHSLVGSVNNYLEINEKTGEIVVTADNAFNYNRQDEIIVQVMAKDTLGEPYHTKYAQLTIKLIDVNHQQPEIQMPQEPVHVEENVPKGYQITNDKNLIIKGTDPDKKGVVQFSIDWAKSFATKPGKNVKREDFVECVEIETFLPDPNKKGEALGILKVKELREGVTIDFEKFETLSLSIVLTDTDQTIGINVATADVSDSVAVSIIRADIVGSAGSALMMDTATLSETSAKEGGMLSIIIDDVNDNAPEWVPGTLETRRIVRELSDKGVFIGSVMATDEDGPLYNNVTYYLKEGKDTPAGLVAIDEKTGQLIVDANQQITCDYPNPRDNLFYDLTASDCDDYYDEEESCNKTPGKIEIVIIDVNNKNPIVNDGQFENVISILENTTTGTLLTEISAFDLDRDLAYRTINYAIDYTIDAELRKFFTVDSATGRMFVTLDGEELDRDEGVDTYYIYTTLTDNYLLEGDGSRYTNKTMITVILLDVNDNAPIFPNDLSWSVSENTPKGFQLTPIVIATDKDEPNTDNSRVQYKVLSLKATSNQNPVNFPEDLIDILSPDNKTGRLITNYPLKGYWGTYTIELFAYDLGVPSMDSKKSFELNIPPYNYEPPTFVFPTEGKIYRLKLETANPGGLDYVNIGKFDEIEATDPDGLGGGIVTFEVVDKGGAIEFFAIDSQSNNKGRLVLIKKVDTKTEFEITIRAKDQGTEPGPLQTEITFKVLFVETEGEPKFDEPRTDTARFTEFEAGLTESKEFARAKDPKNEGCTVDCLEIFYYIIKGASSEFFSLDKNTNTLGVAKQLDRTQQQTHEIIIAATNNRNQIEAVTSADSILNIVIEVREANPMPRFNQSLYAGGISITDKIGKTMFNLMATHTENLEITYSIDKESMKVDPSLQGVKDMAFNLNERTGEVTLNFSPQGSMSGMFEFNVIATDTADKYDTAEVKVYMIADNNRVSFIFENKLTVIQEESKFVADTFTKVFGFQCNIDYILVASDNGVALDNRTEVRSHFINNSVALDAVYISELSTDLTLMRTLRDELRLRNLYLEDFSTDKSETPSESLEKMLQIVLIVVSCVLGTLCIILLVAFCLRTKSLNRRLQALSETKFGSQSSGLNRTGLGATVPGTNKHALEGSNPVWNEELKAPDFDAISNISGDSDLIGVEDNPQFAYEDPAKNAKSRRNTVFDKNKNTAPRRATRQNIGSLEN